MASDSSKTSGTEETPFLDKATHRYCLMALANISWARKTGPAPCSKDSSSCRETTLDRNSWDLEGQQEHPRRREKSINSQKKKEYRKSSSMPTPRAAPGEKTPTLGLEVHQPEASWRACTASGTPRMHLSARRERNVQCSVVLAGPLHPDTVEEG